VYAAADYGCTAAQLFTKNANSWKERKVAEEEVERFFTACRRTGIRLLASHASYLINLASPDGVKHNRSCKALCRELVRAAALSIPFVILHPGAHMGKGERRGMARIAESLRRVFDSIPDVQARLLIETTAGQGSSLGHRFEQIAQILDAAQVEGRVGACLDTCHIFAAGYDIRTQAGVAGTLSEFDRIVGLERLFFIHLNDSKRELGAKVDRHEHIGRGKIGKAAFRAIMTDPRLASIPKIIETPKKEDGKDWDRVNLDLLRSFVDPSIG
jgi:deoxyribonuclease-4